MVHESRKGALAPVLGAKRSLVWAGRSCRAAALNDRGVLGVDRSPIPTRADQYSCRPADGVGVPRQDRVRLLLSVPRKDDLQIAPQGDVGYIPPRHYAGMQLGGNVSSFLFLVPSYGPNGLVQASNDLVRAQNLTRGHG
jgi:hypothetical protein